MNITVEDLSVDEDVLHRPTTAVTKARRKLNRIESESESGDDGEEMTEVLRNNSSSKETDSGTYEPTDEDSKEKDLNDLSVRVNELQIAHPPLPPPPSTPKKTFNFKPPKPASPDIEIIDDQENRPPPEEFVVTDDSSGSEEDEIQKLGAAAPKQKPAPKKSTLSPDIIFDDDDFKAPRRVPPPPPKPAQRSTKFLAELPIPNILGGPSTSNSKVEPESVAIQGMTSEHRDYVSKALKKLVDTIETIPKEGDLADNPPGLRTSLYDHQKYGLQWLWWREHNFPGGGILGKYLLSTNKTTDLNFRYKA